MSSKTHAKFPAGSIIIREKLSKADDARPALLAVMIKRARGFNPAGDDWEFLTVDGAVTKIQERQKHGSCLQCHAAQRDADFVFPVPARK
jgi:Cytochrome P460